MRWRNKKNGDQRAMALRMLGEPGGVPTFFISAPLPWSCCTVMVCRKSDGSEMADPWSFFRSRRRPRLNLPGTNKKNNFRWIVGIRSTLSYCYCLRYIFTLVLPCKYLYAYYFTCPYWNLTILVFILIRSVAELGNASVCETKHCEFNSSAG